MATETATRHKQSMQKKTAQVSDSIVDSNSGQGMSDVATLYNGKSVFITGASGFIGRVLLEKLLRCYTGIKCIYILLRAKKGESPQERLHKWVLNVPLFDSIRALEARDGLRLLEKIVVVPGNIAEPQLGICDEDMQMMLDDETLSIVYHSAASVRFDESLKVSLNLNLVATRTIIEFSRRLKNLVSLCHVSTAYANSHLPVSERIEEKLYPISATPQQVLKMFECMDEKLMQSLKPNLVLNRPNTYTYTKALAEHLIASEAADLPVAIVRPSIVIAAWKDPLPGWIDNINGPTGLMVAVGKGLLRTMHVLPKCRAEVIPVDIVVNTMIASTYYASKSSNKLTLCDQSEALTDLDNMETHEEVDGFKRTKSGFVPLKQPPIFHINSGDLNPIRWGDLATFALPIVRNYPSIEPFRYPFGSFKSNKYYDLFMRLFVHYLPALIVDGMCTVLGKKRRMMWIYGKLYTAIRAFEHFGMHNFVFATRNLEALRGSLNPEDRKELFMDVESINWKEFWNIYTLGCR